MKQLAERLLGTEAAETLVSEEDAASTCRVLEKLRRPLSVLAGTAGVVSLLRRALTVARREAPLLCAVEVNADGSLEGLEGEAAEASVVLVANLLELLTAFIGQALVMRFLQDVWPEFSGPDLNPSGGGTYESAR